MAVIDWQGMKALEGKQVRVTINRDPLVTTEGELVSLDEFGEAALKKPDGRVLCSWPALEMEDLT
ncbi:hypothetical protein AB0B57_22475 [Micromonospora sp. NPDC049101]|uniref:hypothetical protein n=1 Tax=Micromonospora sp. NPDC049101 TaxID=3155032 RepID=UPI0033DCCA6F